MCLFIFIAFIMFYCSLTFHYELRPPGILHVPIWPSAQFKFETPAVEHTGPEKFPHKATCV